MFSDRVLLFKHHQPIIVKCVLLDGMVKVGIGCFEQVRGNQVR